MSAGNNPIILPIKPQIPTYCQSSWQAAIAARPENVRRARFCQNIARLRKYLKSVLSDNIKILRPDLELELVPYESKVAPHLTQKMPDVLHNGQLQILFAMLFRQLQKLQVILILHRQLCLVPVFFQERPCRNLSGLSNTADSSVPRYDGSIHPWSSHISWSFHIELTLFQAFAFVHNGNVMPPSNFSYTP